MGKRNKSYKVKNLSKVNTTIYKNGDIFYTDRSIGILQKEKVKTIGDITDLSEYAKKEDIPDVSSFVTSEYLSDYAKKEDIPDVSSFVTSEDLSDYAKKEDIPDVSSFVTSEDLSDYAKKEDIPD